MTRSSSIYLLAVVFCIAALPGAASSQVGVITDVQPDKVFVFGNHKIAATLEVKARHLNITSIEDSTTHAKLRPHEAFVLVLTDGREIPSSAMELTGRLSASSLPQEDTASRAAAHERGRQICADLLDEPTSARVHWCIVSRGESPYLRQEITIYASAQPLALSDILLFRFHQPMAHVVGEVAGSPILSGNFYLGFEHPLSHNSSEKGEVVSGLKRTLPLSPEQSITYSSVVGVARSGQMRRDFLAYIEQERAHPYRTFLHYNTWYDLAFVGDRFNMAGVLDRINFFGQELVRKRGVQMDSFLMDDGWDDTSSLWNFNTGFPDGFTPLRATAARYGFGIGVWMSPWGGYQREKQQRIAYGKAQGYEIVKDGYALSGPRYYEKFEATCLNFVTRYGVNQFKFDGTGNADQVFPGSLFDSDFSAAIHLIERIRQVDNQIFINLTSGTKPSPFWLRYADSIWRGGHDYDFTGEGSSRQRWITFRDAQTYKNIVSSGPLFPLNSLMLHGLIYAQKAEHLEDDPNHDFAAEVHSYFSSGTQLQEMYITPSLLTSADWDVLAESARWSRNNASILRDTHWIGGSPARGEPYGWASWNADSAILVLRNPTSHVQKISIDAQNAFEIPSGAAQHYVMHSPWAADSGKPNIKLDAHHPHIFALQPFEVMTLQTHEK
jgi:hypothetical protein